MIKNNFGKRPINTFPVTRETKGEKKEAEKEEDEKQAEREGKKREKFDDT